MEAREMSVVLPPNLMDLVSGGSGVDNPGVITWRRNLPVETGVSFLTFLPNRDLVPVLRDRSS
jgi:hypothetical protein